MNFFQHKLLPGKLSGRIIVGNRKLRPQNALIFDKSIQVRQRRRDFLLLAQISNIDRLFGSGINKAYAKQIEQQTKA